MSPTFEEDEFAAFGRNVPRCKAKKQYTNERCKLPAMRGMDVCLRHGGKTPTGEYSPHHKTGLYSKHLVRDSAEKYEEILASEDLFNLRNEVALLKTMLAEELENSQDGGSPRTWLKLKTRWGRFMKAVESGNTAKQTELLFDLDEFINDNVRVVEAKREVKNLSVPISRLIKTHNDLLIARDQMMSMDKVFILLSVALKSFRESVHAQIEDKQEIDAIMIDASRRFEMITGPGKTDVDSSE